MANMFRKYSQAQIINDFGQFQSNNIYSASLSASTDTILTVPNLVTIGDTWTKANRTVLAIVRVKYDAEVYMAVNNTATVPAGASFAATDSELVEPHPGIGRVVKEGDELHFITPDASTGVTVLFYPYYT